MIQLHKRTLLVIASIVAAAGMANATEASYRFRCQSKELGVVEIVLSNPVQRTIGCSYFDVDVTRYDLNGNLVEKRHQPEKDSSMDQTFNARFCKDDPSVTVHVPVTSVDWPAHRNECWANGAFAGANLDLDVKTGAIHHLQGNRTYFTMQELNPATTMGWVNRGGPFRILVPFLNGKECGQDSANGDYAASEPTCRIF